MSRFVRRIVAVASQHATARAAELPRRIPGIIRPVSTCQGTVSELLIYISAVLELQLAAPRCTIMHECLLLEVLHLCLKEYFRS